MVKHAYLKMSLLGAVLLSPVPAIAQDGTPQNESVEQDTSSKVKVGNKLYARNEMVCKRQAQTGTRIKTKTCLTAGQWYQLELDGKAMTEDMQAGVFSTQLDQ